jgi:hypothetical protein
MATSNFDPGREPKSEDLTPDTASRADPAEDRSRPPLTGTPQFGTAMGAAMLGFEQALRSQPPPEVMAAEHRPIRGLSGQEGEVIVFPEEPPAEQEADR